MSSTTVDSRIPASINQRLKKLRGAIVRFLWIDGLSKVLALLVLLVLVDLGIDRVFKMDLAQRGIMLAFMAAMLLGAVYYWLIRPLSKKEVETIHEASLDILAKIGFTYEAGLDNTLVMLENAGAVVDRKIDRVYFPRALIIEQAAKAPAQVMLYSRDGRNDLNLTEDRVHLGTGGAAIKILDLETEDPRPSTLDDLYQLGRLVDRLGNIHFFLRPCIPTDFLIGSL